MSAFDLAINSSVAEIIQMLARMHSHVKAFDLSKNDTATSARKTPYPVTTFMCIQAEHITSFLNVIALTIAIRRSTKLKYPKSVLHTHILNFGVNS